MLQFLGYFWVIHLLGSLLYIMYYDMFLSLSASAEIKPSIVQGWVWLWFGMAPGRIGTLACFACCKVNSVCVRSPWGHGMATTQSRFYIRYIIIIRSTHVAGAILHHLLPIVFDGSPHTFKL